MDITPTLLELTGLPADDGMHGKSLLRQLTHPEEAGEHRPFVYSTYTNTLAHGEKDNKSYGTMIRTRRYKIVNYHGHGTGELFDMKEDPGESVGWAGFLPMRFAPCYIDSMGKRVVHPTIARAICLLGYWT